MRRKRFSPEQIVSVFKQAEMGLAASDLVHQVGIAKQAFYRWRRQYGGLGSDQVRELKQVIGENNRLKKLVAELSLDEDVLSKKPRPAVMKEVVEYVVASHGYSEPSARLLCLQVDATASLEPAAGEYIEPAHRGPPADA